MAKRGKHQQGPEKRKDKRAKIVEDDTALWQAFTQNIDPLELKGRVPDTESALLDEMLKREGAKSRREPGHEAKARKPQTANQAGGQTGGKVKPGGPGAPSVPGATPPAPQKNAIDARQVRRMGKGRSGVDARIDLHGMRQSEAHAALRVFLFRSVAKGHRMVLVITGKGTAAPLGDGEQRFGAFVNEGALGRGVLRRNVPLWLAEADLRAIVVGYTAAHIRHGGEGALYVQLRRRK